MILLSSARKKFIDNLKVKGRADATIIAYSKDIEQLVDYLERSNLLNAHEISRVNIDNFLKHLSDANYTKKTVLFNNH